MLARSPTFAEVTARLGVVVEVCWPYQPRKKGSAENLVGWVKGSFFKAHRSLDADDLPMQLKAWHEEVNGRRPSRATGRIPGDLLRAEELGRLRPVKVHPDQLDLRFAVRVGPTGMVTFETHHYSTHPIVCQQERSGRVAVALHRAAASDGPSFGPQTRSICPGLGPAKRLSGPSRHPADTLGTKTAA